MPGDPNSLSLPVLSSGSERPRNATWGDDKLEKRNVSGTTFWQEDSNQDLDLTWPSSVPGKSGDTHELPLAIALDRGTSPLLQEGGGALWLWELGGPRGLLCVRLESECCASWAVSWSRSKCSPGT